MLAHLVDIAVKRVGQRPLLFLLMFETILVILIVPSRQGLHQVYVYAVFLYNRIGVLMVFLEFFAEVLIADQTLYKTFDQGDSVKLLFGPGSENTPVM